MMITGQSKIKKKYSHDMQPHLYFNVELPLELIQDMHGMIGEEGAIKMLTDAITDEFKKQFQFFWAEQEHLED